MEGIVSDPRGGLVAQSSDPATMATPTSEANGTAAGGKLDAAATLTEEEPQRMPSAYENSSCCSKVLFSWVSPLVKTGYKRQLVSSDLWEVGYRQKGTTNYNRLDVNWQKELTRPVEKRSLWRAVWRTYRKDLITSFLIMCLWIGLGLISGGYVMSELVAYYSNRDTEGIGIGLMWVGIFAVLEISRSFAVNQMWISGEPDPRQTMLLSFCNAPH